MNPQKWSALLCVCLSLFLHLSRAVSEAVIGEYGRNWRQGRHLTNVNTGCIPMNYCRYVTICQNGGTCNYDYDTCKLFCTCPRGYGGVRCESGDQSGTSESISQWTGDRLEAGRTPHTRRNTFIRTPTSSNLAKTSTKIVQSMANETCRTIKRKTKNCPQHFPCKNGVCVFEAIRSEKNLGAQMITCLCDPGWTTYFCDVCCDLDCGVNGTCKIQNGSKVCACSWGNGGMFCNETVELISGSTKDFGQASDNMVQVVVMVLCGSLALILGVAIVAVPYILWKKRFLLVMKLAYLLQPYEDDASTYLYDAFISYKSSEADENFVVHTLYPKLEKEFHLKLCLHFRDFVPGEAIANNIIHAVEKSRRTILLLTPDYIEQDRWTRFEYQVAQQEMLKMRHRIIPIIFRKINAVSDMDENLRFLLASTTYLEWPGTDEPKKEKKFWERLRLSLPKLRNIPKHKSNPVSLNIMTNTKGSSEYSSSNKVLISTSALTGEAGVLIE